MIVGIISIILGVVFIVGLIFYKPNLVKQSENPLNDVYRRGLEILPPILRWVVPIFLVGSGIYYLINLNQEARLEREAREMEMARYVHLEQLMDIVNTPMHEREMKILALDFVPGGTNEFGKFYERDIGETIELFETGTIRYLSMNNDAYLRIFNETKRDSFEFEKEVSNNVGDKFSRYSKRNYDCSFGYFTSNKQYCCSFTNDLITSVPTEFLPNSFLVGSWGRVSTLSGGKYTFFENSTFVFEDSRQGKITGKWKTEKKNIILNYDKKIREYGFPHHLSMITEIVTVTDKKESKIEGYLDGNEYITITLSRQ